MQNGGDDGKSSAPNTLFKMAGASRVQRRCNQRLDLVQKQQQRLRLRSVPRIPRELSPLSAMGSL